MASPCRAGFHANILGFRGTEDPVYALGFVDCLQNHSVPRLMSHPRIFYCLVNAGEVDFSSAWTQKCVGRRYNAIRIPLRWTGNLDRDQTAPGGAGRPGVRFVNEGCLNESQQDHRRPEHLALQSLPKRASCQRRPTSPPRSFQREGYVSFRNANREPECCGAA